MAINLGSVAPSLGRAAGTGLSQGLESLAQNKLAEMQKSRQIKELSPYLGEDVAKLLLGLPKDIQKTAFENIGDIAALVQSQKQPRGSRQTETGLGALMPQEAQTRNAPQLKTPSSGDILAALSMGKQISPFAGLEQESQPLAPQRTEQPLQEAPEQEESLLQKAFTPKHQKIEQRKLGIQEETLASKNSKEAREFSKPYLERANAARNNIRDYNILIKAAQNGNLRAGNTQQILSRLGLEDFNRDLTTEIAGKTIARLAQNVSGAFGTNSRLTNFLEQTFQRSLPTLWNTPQGIVVISTLNKLADEGNIIKDDIRKQIIRENKGRIPFDADDQVLERAQPQLDKLEEEAINIASNPPSINKRFEQAPKASDYPGRRLQFPDGTIKKSNGREWVKE